MVAGELGVLDRPPRFVDLKLLHNSTPAELDARWEELIGGQRLH